MHNPQLMAGHLGLAVSSIVVNQLITSPNKAFMAHEKVVLPRMIEDGQIEALERLGYFKKAKVLDVSLCQQVSGEGLEKLKNLTVLRSLDLSKCQQITDLD